MGSAILFSVLALTVVPEVAAHEGSAHAGVPHWILLALVGVGVVSIVGIGFLGRRWDSIGFRLIVPGVLLGVLAVMIGVIGLVEIQVEPSGTTSSAHRWYPALTGAVGVTITTGSLVVGRYRWPDRPAYAAVGLVLGGWVLYPVAFSGAAYRHPLGYLIVLGVPVLVGYILWRDVLSVLDPGTIDRSSRLLGTLLALLFAVFFLFSAGLLSVSPDGVAAERGAFVTVDSFANPLVIWPALEFYVPAIPLGGAISVGTAIVAGMLAGLVGVNTALLASIGRLGVDVSSSNGVLGAVATVGATTCTCCGPAIYAIASVGLGTAASPLYWAFIDPNSPVGALFLVASIVLLLGSAITFADRLRGAEDCTVP